MKKKGVLWGILAFILVFGMTVIGCDDGTPRDDYEYDDRPSIRGFARIDNLYPVIGETIIASYDKNTWHDDPIGTPSWIWYKTQEDASFLSSVINKTSIGYSNTYTVRQDDVGFWIWAELSYSGHSGTIDRRTVSTVIGIPATATVSVSIRALYFPSYSSNNHFVEVKLILSDGRWKDIDGRWEGFTYISPYSIVSQWITISGVPSISSWYTGSLTPSVSAEGRELVISYWTRSETALSINNLTATLNNTELSAMRSSTNVYNTLSAGTPTTASISQWTISQ